MNLQRIDEIISGYMEASSGNYVVEDIAIRPDLAGMRMYELHTVGVASPDDEYFQACLDPNAIGPHFMGPRKWLPEAKSVVSVFLTLSPKVTESNALVKTWPSDEWLHARIEGNTFINSLMAHLKDALEADGYPTVIPSSDPRFCSVSGKKAGTNVNTEKLAGLSFTSVWSERHAAYACGLGTFGLSKGIITKYGMAGRLGSVVTALDLPRTKRDYTGLYEYCTMCGACVTNCPVGAISIEGGKNHEICSEFLGKTMDRYRPRYGCGKCQVAVPCQQAAPGA